MNETLIETIVPATHWSLPVVAAVACLGFLIVWMVWRNVRFLRFWQQRWSLIVLRTLSVILFLLVFLEPTLRERRIRRVRNQIAVLVDNSVSMNTATRGGTRAQEARDYLQSLEADLQELEEAHDFRWYTFGASLSPIEREDLLEEKEANEASTRFLESISDLSRAMKGKDLAGVVVLSDGVDNGVLHQIQSGQSSPVREVTQALEKLKAPIHYVQIGKSAAFSDIRISQLDAPGFTFVMNAASLDAVVDVQGEIPDFLELSLFEDGQPSRTERLPTIPGKRSYRVSLPFLPRRVGDHVYTVRVGPKAGDQYLENNERSALVPAIRDRIRVLQVAGHPSFDVRFLRDYLKSNPNVDLVSFFILIDRNDVRVNADETSLIPFPVQELFEQELPGFDLVVFQDFEYGPFGVGQYLPHVKKFVENGGALAVVGGGRSFEMGNYQGTVLEEILPVKLHSVGADKIEGEQEYRAQVAEGGANHPVLRILPDDRENLAILQKMPPLRGLNRVFGLKQDALALLEHPSLRDRSGKAAPVVALREVGEGRTLAVMTDSLWRWNFLNAGNSGDAYPYNRFWTAAIDWLMHDPEMNPLGLAVEPSTAFDGEEILAQLRVLTPTYQVAPKHGCTLKVFKNDISKGEGGSLVYDSDSCKSGEDGLARVLFTPPGPGVYRIEASARFDDRVLQAERLLVVDPGTEEQVRVYDSEGLFDLVAKASGGGVYDPSEDASRLNFRQPETLLVSSERERPIWSHAGVLFLAIFFLAVEWALRKRFGLP